jgi:hypothetical protein
MRSVRRARWASKWRVQINFDDSDGDCGFEAVAAVARRGMRSRVEWGCMEGEARSLVNARNASADGGREGREGAAIATCKANK